MKGTLVGLRAGGWWAGRFALNVIVTRPTPVYSNVANLLEVDCPRVVWQRLVALACWSGRRRDLQCGSMPFCHLCLHVCYT